HHSELETSILYFRRSLSWNMTFQKNSSLRQETSWRNFWF
ncbi:PDPK1 isoform 7, partial [Pan troglodytes]